MKKETGSEGSILVVDDVPENLDLLCKILTDAGFSARSTTNGRFALQAVRAAPPELILLDIKMPEMDGFEVCRCLHEDPELRTIPVIFISALGDIHDKVEAFEAGGVDYVTKPFQAAEVLARVRTHLSLYRMQTGLEELVAKRNADLLEKTLKLEEEIEERKKSQAALHDAEFRYRTVADFTYAWEYWEGPDGALRYVSPSCKRISGYPSQAFLDDPDLLHRIVKEEDRAIWLAHRHEVSTHFKPRELELRICCADGRVRWIEHTCQAVIDNAGAFLGFRVSNRDVSERKELEEELRQAQKMEAIGTLAGGIAHDFNNILSSIFGYTELALVFPDTPLKVREYCETVLASARRAKDLVTQILAFSRRSEQDLRPLQVSLIIEEATKLLRASLPSSITINQDIRTADEVLADPTQIHQVIMNLCTNAYHAMRETGGTLSISLRRVMLQEDNELPCHGVVPGTYVLLEVSDTGHGMDNATVERIFNPYFTTKSKSEGTGLGLAVVDGIVRNHKGHIIVFSEPEVGTSFKVYLPIFDSREGVVLSVSAAPEEPFLPTGTEHIVVVDDEANVVALCRDILARYGYAVSAFTSSQEALSFFCRNPSRVDLVLTDLTMPVMNGIELVKRLLAIEPELPAIICTGHSDLINWENPSSEGVAAYLQKPFTGQVLLQTLRKVLDEHK